MIRDRFIRIDKLNKFFNLKNIRKKKLFVNENHRGSARTFSVASYVEVTDPWDSWWYIAEAEGPLNMQNLKPQVPKD